MATLTPVAVDIQKSQEFPLQNLGQTEQAEGNLSGRITTEIKDFFIDFGKGFVEVARKTAVYVGQLFRDCGSLARVCRIGITAFSLIEKCVGHPGIFTAINSQLATSESLIYTVGVGDQIKYFGTLQQKEESILQNMGQGFLLAAGIGGVIVLLGEAFCACFSWVAEAVGSLPVFGAFAECGLGLGQLVSSIAALGFFAFACDSASKLAHSKTTEQAVQATLDLAWNISELALAIFVTVSDDWIGFLVLGTLSAGLGIASFIYSKHAESVKEEQQKQLKLV